MRSRNWKGDAMSAISCTWSQDGDEGSSLFATSCGKWFEFNEGTPLENNAKYCLYCGGALVQRLIEPYEDEENTAEIGKAMP